jgi:cis-3-alkyl-4-acyloxetan-2-one decarboxylase
VTTITVNSQFPAPARPGVPDWRAAYPFAGQYLRVAGRAMHYVDESPDKSSGVADGVLLMVHGNPTWSFHWRELIKAWQGQFRVIAPDHLGCGISDLPEGHPVRLADRIAHLIQLIETLDLRHITLVAHDWGGAIGLGAALATADRFERIVLFNTGAFPPWFIPWRIRLARLPLLGRLAVQGPNLFLRAALQLALANPRVLTPESRAGYLAPYNSWHRRQAIYDFVVDIPRSPRHPTYATLAEIEAGLARLSDRPLLLVWGMRDWCFTPACLDRFRELLPHAEVHPIETAGHWVVEDARAEVIDRVGTFLSD